MSRAMSMTGNIAAVFLSIAPPANNDEPIRHNAENRNAPTGHKYTELLQILSYITGWIIGVTTCIFDP